MGHKRKGSLKKDLIVYVKAPLKDFNEGEDQRADKYSSNSQSQENIDFLYACVVEEPTMSIR